MKRILTRIASGVGALAVALTGVAGLSESAQAAPSFSDVPANHQQYADIVWLANSGITTGYDDKTFKPSAAVNRDAFAAFLYRMAGKPDYTAPATPKFTDVPTGHPFYKEISWLASTGITTGWSDGTFRPGQPISRDAMAAFMYRFACEPFFHNGQDFRDVSQNRSFFKEISWMRTSGLSKGWSDNTYRPGSRTERGAMAAFLHRFALSGISHKPSCSVKAMNIDNDPAYVSFESKMRLATTSGTGSHAKITMGNEAGLVSFGIQYEQHIRHAYPQYPGNTVFLIENMPGATATIPGVVGKDYHYAAAAQRDKWYTVRLSYYTEDRTIRAYVDGVEIARRKTALNSASRLFFQLEGSAAHHGDVLNADFENARIKVGDKTSNYGVIGTWNPACEGPGAAVACFGLSSKITKWGENRSDGQFATLYNGTGNGVQGISATISGTANVPEKTDSSGRKFRPDWDQTPMYFGAATSGTIKIAQHWGE